MWILSTSVSLCMLLLLSSSSSEEENEDKSSGSEVSLSLSDNSDIWCKDCPGTHWLGLKWVMDFMIIRTWESNSVKFSWVLCGLCQYLQTLQLSIISNQKISDLLFKSYNITWSTFCAYIMGAPKNDILQSHFLPRIRMRKRPNSFQSIAECTNINIAVSVSLFDPSSTSLSPMVALMGTSELGLGTSIDT